MFVEKNIGFNLLEREREREAGKKTMCFNNFFNEALKPQQEQVPDIHMERYMN